MGETLSSQTVSTKLQRIAEAAKANPERAFTTLAHFIDVEWLRECWASRRFVNHGCACSDWATVGSPDALGHCGKLSRRGRS